MNKISFGHWRFVQSAVQLYAVYTGIRGLILGPVPGQPIALVFGVGNSLITYLFYASLLIGGLCARIGEVRQMRYPLDRDGSFVKFVEGLTFEASGNALIALNFFALTCAIFATPSSIIPHERASFYIFISVGFLLRSFQAMSSIRALRNTVREAIEDGYDKSP